MKANELRIGNCCEYLLEDKFENPDNLWSLNVIDAEDILYLSKYPDCENYRPIVLTPEVLEKCGFEFDESVYKSKIYGNNEWIEFDKDGDCFNVFLKQGNVTGSDDVILLYTQIDYLHQLQNLYFALTGEELTYTP